MLEEYLGGEVAADSLELGIEAALDDVLVIVGFGEAGTVALHVLKDEHVLLRCVAEGGVVEEPELATVDHLLGSLGGLGAERAATGLVVLMVDLPCAFEETHAAQEAEGAFAAHTAFGYVGCGFEQIGSGPEVVDDEIGHFGAVVAAAEEQGAVGVDGFVDDDHVAELLQKLEIVPCTEEVGLAQGLADALGVATVALGVLDEQVATADAVVCAGVVAVAFRHGVRTGGDSVAALVVADEVAVAVAVHIVGIDGAEVRQPVVEFVGKEFKVAGFAPEIAVADVFLRRQVEAGCGCREPWRRLP